MPTSDSDNGLPQQLQNILNKLSVGSTEEEKNLVRKAYAYAAAAHAGQMRLSGEPYLSHPVAVAEILAELGFDVHAISAGLLHDTVEDTGATIDDIDEEFGEQVADIVDGVTKISRLIFDSKEEQQAESIRKMILATSHDIRVPIVKLADRVHNMRTLDFQKVHKQQRIARETMDIYVPLANRLGLHRIKLELEELSFKYLEPDKYAQIKEWLTTNQVVERQIISKIISHIEKILKDNDISGTVFGRIKHIYSIYRKMTEQHLTLDDMHDILAFRAIVRDVRDCYAVLGLVHAEWKPVPGRFKDYISMPKANGYQSLHTTVIGLEGERIEIQIRTEEMHRMAEHGVASHWLYKERNHAVNIKDAPQFEWLREIVSRQGDEADSKEFMRSLRMDLFSDEVYVFTPKGAVKELPEGATPLDFAFLIHSEVGFHCTGAKINGKLEPLSTPLKNGDTVEVLTDKNRHPSRDWLKIVKTAKARNRIQQYLRTEERAISVGLGREILEKEGRKMGINIQRAEKDGWLVQLTNVLAAGSVDELFSSLGYARLQAKPVLRRLQKLMGLDENHSEDSIDGVALHRKNIKAKKEKEKDPEEKKPSSGILVRGMDDMLIRIARCCNPVPGDQIVGFISRGRGVIIHTASCPTIQTMEPERMISAQWAGQENHPFPVGIHMLMKNEKGMLASIAIILRDEDVNIERCMIQAMVDGRSEADMQIMVRDLVHLYQIIDRLRHIPNVIEVVRKTAEAE
ncbi:MAG: bifunctional (p)ppGpp synthetase/guanosine-3',5'-bis(diphosphate) 3'-pyrophosphohydrolase [Desulfovibrionaceae bacterium]|nr:bifunctional (p)ppGpp synthetase/guanosine-3',5'-bis(diphosphate) 3'-pyrophosphohydrolase [Desulfovibrionaceae bacterium]